MSDLVVDEHADTCPDGNCCHEGDHVCERVRLKPRQLSCDKLKRESDAEHQECLDGSSALGFWISQVLADHPEEGEPEEQGGESEPDGEKVGQGFHDVSFRFWLV